MGSPKIWLAAVLLGVAGCAVVTEPVTDKIAQERAEADKAVLFAGQEALDHPVTLYEAMARAVKFNLDQRLKLMEEALAHGEFELARLDLLPLMDARAERLGRNNDSGGGSASFDGSPTDETGSTSTTRWTNNLSVGAVWNLLDFGISYVRAQQSSDRAWIARERRRKAINDTIQNVRWAYWRAVGAAYARKDLEKLLEKTRSVLKRSREMEEAGIQNPQEALAFQRGLMEVERRLLDLRREVWNAKTELGVLMNVKPGTVFRVALPMGGALTMPRFEQPVTVLEDLALVRRPELREEDYQKRITAGEVKQAYLSFLPGLELSSTYNRSSNQLLTHQHWLEYGAQISLNLKNIVSAPMKLEVANAQIDMGEMRRLALSMAAITQVNLAHGNYRMSREDFQLAERLAEVNKRLLTSVEGSAKASAQGEFELVRQSAMELSARMRKFTVYAQMQQALGRLMAAAGLDPLPPEVPSRAVDDLADAIQTNLARLDTGSVPTVPPPPPPEPATAAKKGGHGFNLIADAPPAQKTTLALPLRRKGVIDNRRVMDRDPHRERVVRPPNVEGAAPPASPLKKNFGKKPRAPLWVIPSSRAGKQQIVKKEAPPTPMEAWWKKVTTPDSGWSRDWRW